MHRKLYKKIKKTIGRANYFPDDNEHSRFSAWKDPGQNILIKNIPYIFTCDENDKLVCKKNYSIVIENEKIAKVLPSGKITDKNFDIVYDAGKRGGIVVTPGLINTHSHIHMYLLRSAMMLDEEESVDRTIEAMGRWQRNETDDSYAFSAVGDITEQQKSGITTTLTHGPSFFASEAAARASAHNLINAVSAISNSRPENSPEMVEKLLKEKEEFFSTPAIALHYLFKAKKTDLEKVRKIMEAHDILLTFHMAESSEVVQQTLRKHGMSEVEILKKYRFLNSRSVASHAIYLKPDEIVQISESKMGVSHLPTSNVIHKSGTFQFWKFWEAKGFPAISLGTDSVVSKNRLDLLSEAYQARITHLYSRTIKFGSLFKMMTANGARVLNMPSRGKIIPGMRADLAFWKLKDRGFVPFDEKEPMTLLGNLITHGGRMVRDLMINGRFVIKSRRHQLVDESKLLAVLQKEHMKMRRRVKKT